jgi:hypothetical protein
LDDYSSEEHVDGGLGVQRFGGVITRVIMGQNSPQLSVAEYQALITGIPKYLENATFMVASQTFTAAEAVALFQALHDSSAAVVAAKAMWKQLALAEDAAEAHDGAIARDLRRVVARAFSNAPATLQAFMLSPRKKREPLSAEARLVATAKARATRVARGTLGTAQRAAIRGNVVGVTVTPILAPAAVGAPTVSAASVPGGATSAGTPEQQPRDLVREARAPP